MSRKSAASVDALSEQEALEEAEALRQELSHHDHRYYVLDDPEISDAEYDQLFARLEAIERRFPRLVSPDSPTQRVGAPPREELGTVRHEVPMRSLQSTTSEAAVRRFFDTCKKELGADVDWVGELKFDGLSVELVYDGGRLTAGSTRGDGTTGEDVMANLRTIGEIPLRLPPRPRAARPPEHLVVRGEVYMQLSEFRELNRRQEEAGAKTFANPRNAAAGSLRQLDPGVTARRPLHAFFWEIASASSERPDTHWGCLELLEQLGFRVSSEARRLEDVERALEWRQTIVQQRADLDYEIDGVVIKVNPLSGHERMGVRSANPRWALAYKFPSRQAAARIRSIVVSVGRTGKLTPVAILEPVRISGAEVTNVSLHNQDEVDRKDVRAGDKAIIERAGDVIPHLVRVLPEARTGDEQPFTLPEQCPVCGADAVRLEGEADRRCTNASCPAQVKGRVLHFGSRQALDIDGLGERHVEQLLQAGLIETYVDLFDLKVEDLVGLERVAQKSAENLVRSIQRSRERVTLPRLIYGLGIPLVGRATADVLATELGSLGELAEADRGRLERIADIGPTMASAIRSWFEREANQRIVAGLAAHGLDPRAERTTSRRLGGTTIVFTGTLSIPREEASELVRQAGGRATSSVSKNTDYLVRGADPGGSKLTAATRHGVKVIGEQEFLKLVQGAG